MTFFAKLIEVSLVIARVDRFNRLKVDKINRSSCLTNNLIYIDVSLIDDKSYSLI